MVPALALTAGLLALALSLLAIVLATIANRRHMATRRGTAAPEVRARVPRDHDGAAEEDAGDRALAMRHLRDRMDALDRIVAELSGSVARLADPLAAGESRLDALDAQLEPWPPRIAGLEVGVAEIRGSQSDLDERARVIGDRLDSVTARLDALADDAAEARSRQERVAHALEGTDQRVADQMHTVAAEMQSLTGQVAALRDHVLSSDPNALRHVAVVRYDAFADVGGRLSYSLAVLDDTDSGFVVTTLAGKAEVRTYVRAVSGGEGDGTLTAEEQQAIEAARQAAGSRP